MNEAGTRSRADPALQGGGGGRDYSVYSVHCTNGATGYAPVQCWYSVDVI